MLDTDFHARCEWIFDQVTGEPDGIWRDDKRTELLSTHDGPMLFVSGCKTNQGNFYSNFAAEVLLSAPTQTILHQLASRTNNPYGKSPED